MDVEPRLGTAFDRSAEGVQPDVPAALREVHGRARRRTTNRRAAVVVAIAIVVTVAGVAAMLGAPDSRHSQDPVSPSQDEGAVTVEAVREASAQELGLRKLLRVAVSEDGRVYVTDSSQQVAELTADLDVLRTWGVSGEGPGQFRLVQGSIDVGPDGSVYVSDSGNFRVQEFTPDGEFVRSVGEFGNGPGQFTWPFDLAIDSDGNIYVADDKEQTLAKLSPSGRQMWRLGGLRETEPRLRGHFHLSGFDQHGNLVVAIDDLGLVALIGANGRLLDTAPISSGPTQACDASLDAAGRYYVTSCLAPWRLRVFAADGTPLTTLNEPGLVQSPQWTDDGRGFAVTEDGGVVELRTVDH